MLKNADALLIRTRTKCTENLLEGNKGQVYWLLQPLDLIISIHSIATEIKLNGQMLRDVIHHLFSNILQQLCLNFPVIKF